MKIEVTNPWFVYILDKLKGKEMSIGEFIQSAKVKHEGLRMREALEKKIYNDNQLDLPEFPHQVGEFLKEHKLETPTKEGHEEEINYLYGLMVARIIELGRITESLENLNP